MTKFVLMAALAALCSCAQETAEPAEEATQAATVEQPAPTVAEVAGTYDYTLADGAKGITVMAADGTFSDTLEGGTVTGAWSLAEGKTCMDPEGDAPGQQQRCYTLGESDAAGFQTATADDGSVVKIRKQDA